MTEAIAIERPVIRKDSFEFERYKQFYKYFPAGTRSVLDVGCNTGRGGTSLKKIDPDLELYGLDLSEKRLAEVPKDAYTDTILGSCTDIPAESDSFDVVVQGEFIEHLSFADTIPTLTECYRVVRSGGRLMLTTPNPEYFLLKINGKSVMGGEHISQHYYRSMIDLLHYAGFSDVKARGTGKVSRYLGEHFPLMAAYGSYMLIASK